MNPLYQYLTTACTSTGQATFYNAKKDQEDALQKAHSDMLTFDRRAYAITAVLPITDRSKQLVLNNLLATGAHCTNSRLEGQIISMLVGDMQFNRILNMYMELVEKGTNCGRVRNLGKLIWAQVDAYRAIKYRPKLRKILRHAHIPEGSDPARAEIYKWLSRKILNPAEIVHNPKLAARMNARTQYAALFELPFDIARDLAVNIYGKKAAEFEKEFVGTASKAGKGTATKKETMRARARTGETIVDFEKFDLFDLFMHAHRNVEDQAAVILAVNKRAASIAETMILPSKIALVVDNSVSALGSAERRFQPLAMMESIIHVCQATESDVKVYYVGPEMKNGMLQAEGGTDIRRPLVFALKERPDLVMILSDGYENVRSGSVAQILNTKVVQESGISVIHLNPVAAAEAKTGVRKLVQNGSTFALASPSQLPMMMLLEMSEKNPKLLDPFFTEVEKHLITGDFKSARLMTRGIGFNALSEVTSAEDVPV